MAYANLNGRSIYYEDTGGRGQALVWSHGFLMDREMFAPNIGALGEGFRSIAWDQRGFGETSGVPERYDFWDSARDLLALMDHLEIKQATLVGLSQGGFASMRAALLAPERVRALVLLATRADRDDEASHARFRELRAEWLENGPRNAGAGLAEVLIGRNYDTSPWLEKWRRMPREAIAAPIDAIIERDDLTSRLGEIRCPALVIHGTADAAIDIAHGKALAQALPACAGFVSVPDAGHAPNLTHPQSVNSALAEFLRSCPTP
jgi:pimeloyl-ACP methyl ester carboxylesterase